MLEQKIYELIKDLKKKKAQSAPLTVSQVPTQPQDPFAPSEVEEKKEQWRRGIFLVGIFLLLLIGLLPWLWSKWLGMVNGETQNLTPWIVGVAVIGVLIGIKIIVGIFQQIFKVLSANQETAKKIKNPVFKVIFFILMLQIAFSMFEVAIRLIFDTGLNEKINHYVQEGFEIDVETDSGPKTIKFENGTFSIEAPNH